MNLLHSMIVLTAKRILVSGASGLIGSALVSALEELGCPVIRLTRKPTAGGNALAWDPSRALPPELVSGFEAVIHLAGEPVAARWTAAKKNAIFDSRVVGTKYLSEALAHAPQPPRVLISASAIGYYGDGGDEIVNENSPSGEGFLPEVCREWEAATRPAAEAGIRTVQIRIGVVLSAAGGALKEMLPPFRAGLGAKIGDGPQWMSWIHIEDLVGAILYILNNDRLEGPVNVVAPAPVRNLEFTKILASVLHRPAILRIPTFAVRMIFGEMADEVLLGSQRVEPEKLIRSGFDFKYANLRSALQEILGHG